MLYGYDGVDLPVVGQIELVGVAFPVDLPNDERAGALLAEFRVALTWDPVSVVKLNKGPVTGFQL